MDTIRRVWVQEAEHDWHAMRRQWGDSHSTTTVARVLFQDLRTEWEKNSGQSYAAMDDVGKSAP